jgi:hypothetical protein
LFYATIVLREILGEAVAKGDPKNRTIFLSPFAFLLRKGRPQFADIFFRRLSTGQQGIRVQGKAIV